MAYPSIHNSEVRVAGELKTCEACATIFIRKEAQQHYCRRCLLSRPALQEQPEYFNLRTGNHHGA